MAFRLFVATTVALAVGLFAVAEPLAQVKPGQTAAAGATPQVTATPQAALIPQAGVKSPAPAAAEVNRDRRDAQSGAVPRDDKPLLEFFELRDRARSVVYAIDCSGSMATHNALDVAKRELLTSLSQLPPDARFAVILYSMKARTLRDDQGHEGLMTATAANRKRVQSQVAEVAPDGGTDHLAALRAALALKPEVIFLLTDADIMTNSDVDEILAEMGKAPGPDVANRTGPGVMVGFRSFIDIFVKKPAEARQTRIPIIEFGRGPETDRRSPLRRLSTTTGASYRYLDETAFPR